MVGKKPKLIYTIIENRDKILEIAKKHSVENIRVFGSVSRKQEKRTSDIDLLVDVITSPDGTRGNYMAFGLEVGSFFNEKRRIDVCTPETLHPRFKEKVLASCISIMEDDPQIDPSIKDERDVFVNVEKAQKAIKNFWRIISLGKKKFVSDRDTQGIARSEMQIAIEEIVRHIPKHIKESIKDVDWTDLRKFRNLIVHYYDNVEWDIMWEFSQEKIKKTEEACRRILEVLEEGKKPKNE